MAKGRVGRSWAVAMAAPALVGLLSLTAPAGPGAALAQTPTPATFACPLLRTLQLAFAGFPGLGQTFDILLIRFGCTASTVPPNPTTTFVPPTTLVPPTTATTTPGTPTTSTTLPVCGTTTSTPQTTVPCTSTTSPGGSSSSTTPGASSSTTPGGSSSTTPGGSPTTLVTPTTAAG